MKYLGLDQSLNTTGGAIFEDSKLITYGEFKTKPTQMIEQRLASIWNELNSLHNIHEFEYVFFEDIQQQKGNVETYKKLAYAQATILLGCYFNDMKYSILSPSHGRKILTDKYGIKFGRSRADQKAAACSFVKEHFSLSLGSDIADAINITHAGILEYKKNESAF